MMLTIFPPVALRPDSSSWPPLTGLRDHTRINHTRYGSSGLVINPMQRPLPDNTQHKQETVTHAPGGIRTPSPNKPAAAEPRLRRHGHWDRQ